ncbi:MAG: hypothetical protein A3K12_02450 [Candidatus Rokubacteria bacterium RIFCSPLOWO2_12_FULL_71_19]|nr:MAG: hypothetical protein A3K12_02450 [Candidatus Rokubacteria bacterium RIFCSPLOWO2_12_FULL_71_19]
MSRSPLLSCEAIGKAYGTRSLFDELSFGLFDGDHVGLVGPNGSGKSTLLRILAGIEPPDRGTRSVRGGVRVPSAGEQARVLIARLMREPADILILDEPTNDLDIPTLEVLEDNLAEFDGGLVLVTHDRFMLERVSTIILALDGRGGAETFADYAQWEAARAPPRPASRDVAARAGARERPCRQRLSSLEQREWDGMEGAILDAETAVEVSRQAAEDPGIAADPAALQTRYAALAAARDLVDRLYVRWAELETKRPSRSPAEE